MKDFIQRDYGGRNPYSLHNLPFYGIETEHAGKIWASCFAELEDIEQLFVSISIGGLDLEYDI